MESCVQEKTFSRNSTIKDAIHHIKYQNSVMEEAMWSSKMATVYYGMCHTFLYPHKLEADMINDGLLFYLEPTINYRIIFHDPKFYHMVSNTFTFPRIWLEYKVGLNMKKDYFDWYYISVTEHHLLNRPEQPCEEKEDYDFLECVKTSQADWATSMSRTVPSSCFASNLMP